MQMALFEIDTAPAFKAPVFDPRCPELRQKVLDALAMGGPDDWFSIGPSGAMAVEANGIFDPNRPHVIDHDFWGIWRPYYGGLLFFMVKDGLLDDRVVHDGKAPTFGGQSSSRGPIEVVWSGRGNQWGAYSGYGYQYRKSIA